MAPAAWCSSEAALLSHHECAMWQIGTLPPPTTGLVPQLWNTVSCLIGPLVSSSGAAIVAVLWPIPFLKCAQPTIQRCEHTHTHTRAHTHARTRAHAHCTSKAPQPHHYRRHQLQLHYILLPAAVLFILLGNLQVWIPDLFPFIDLETVPSTTCCGS